MTLELIDNSFDVTSSLAECVADLHRRGPIDPSILEKLSYIKRFHHHKFAKQESKIVMLMGSFHKASEPTSFTEEVYSIYLNSIRETFGKSYTPVQASILKGVGSNEYFSFSAPTSAGKSYVLRDLIKNFDRDILIIVPSRALIAEFYAEVVEMVGNDVLVMQFVENIYKTNVKRRVFIVTPERAIEVFRHQKDFTLGLILMDEAQISEESIRGLKFDAFFRRADRAFKEAKKIFSHPFVANPEAQLNKHQIVGNSAALKYSQQAVGKIYLSFVNNTFSYFSPYCDPKQLHTTTGDVVEEVIRGGGTALIYTAKAKIYSGEFIGKFARYIKYCNKLEDADAIDIVESLREYIGASKEGVERHSTMIDMMERGIVIHHGSMPLKARLLIEKFIRGNYAKLCFSTSTLTQGINMPFDVVWLDNFTNMNPLTLKNLIGRSGRTRAGNPEFDFGYVVVKRANVTTFCARLNEEYRINDSSALDSELSESNSDYQDIVEAVKEDTFNDDFHMPQRQVDRIAEEDISSDVAFILDSLMGDESLTTAENYYRLTDVNRRKIKTTFERLFTLHLSRRELNTAEKSILSASIPLMLWRVQGKSFSAIVSMRYAFLSRRDERLALVKESLEKASSEGELDKRLRQLHVKYSPTPFTLPNKAKTSTAGLYKQATPAGDIDYDALVYDTYDFLDKVISLSLTDPICAVLEVYFLKTNDERSRTFQKYLRYGTADDKEIWLLKYGIDPEDITWIKEHVLEVNENTIEFRDSILSEPLDRVESTVGRYL